MGSIHESRASGRLVTLSETFYIELPQDVDYTAMLKVPNARTIIETVSESVSGTCTATFKINTTALGGTANSVSTTEQSQAHSSANVMAVDDNLVITISSNAQCKRAALTVVYTVAV